MSNLDVQAQKQKIAEYAIEYLLQHNQKSVIGVGTGSTVNCLIPLLAKHKKKFKGFVSSSRETSSRLYELGAGSLTAGSVCEVYIDGADAYDSQLQLVKGRGGALTRERLIASCADTFICLADESKKVQRLDETSCPVEFIKVAEHALRKRLEKLGAKLEVREEYITDNGMSLGEIYDWNYHDNLQSYRDMIASFPGVLDVGVFVEEKANRLFGCKNDGSLFEIEEGE